jgi:hypothetical protein
MDQDSAIKVVIRGKTAMTAMANGVILKKSLNLLDHLELELTFGR